MLFSYHNPNVSLVNQKKIEVVKKTLTGYCQKIESATPKDPEYSLVYPAEQTLHDELAEVAKKYKGVKEVLLIGIGGSSLGTEAVHEALRGSEDNRLTVLDTIAPSDLSRLDSLLKRVKKHSDLAVCVVSKSGGTTETMSNVAIVIKLLEGKFKAKIRQQFIFISNPDTDFMKAGKRFGGHIVAMPEIIGGRYSVATAVGLVPLQLLGYDVDDYISGYLAASSEEFEGVAKDSASHLYLYAKAGYRHYNFFAFETRLQALGRWYRQLMAESIGKELDKSKKRVKYGFLPTISTPVELHSVGQLYLSGFAGVYTDFVTFDDEELDRDIPNTPFSKHLKGKTAEEVATAIYGGVVAAYQDKKLPYRSTIFADESRAFSLGLFMGLRLREVMYLAHLLNLNAFDQPNVESYKIKTKEILGL